MCRQGALSAHRAIIGIPWLHETAGLHSRQGHLLNERDHYGLRGIMMSSALSLRPTTITQGELSPQLADEQTIPAAKMEMVAGMEDRKKGRGLLAVQLTRMAPRCVQIDLRGADECTDQSHMGGGMGLTILHRDCRFGERLPGRVPTEHRSTQTIYGEKKCADPRLAVGMGMGFTPGYGHAEKNMAPVHDTREPI